jgi:ubiquinone/menaquinone biosynthesis C-methylase UbiE
MLTKAFNRAVRLSPRLGRAMIRSWYQMLVVLDREREISFMNYGYAEIDPGAKDLELSDTESDNRFCIQLYHHVAGAVDLSGKDVVEVGSGRGGGASYIARHLRPRSVLGLDLSDKAVDFCNQSYAVDGLSFRQGDAENLPLPDASVDVVVNLESSHCYGSMDRFLSEVYRVLRPGGYFLFSDHRDADKIQLLHEQLEKCGFSQEKETDITPNVVRALELDDDRKQRLIEKKCPKVLRGRMAEFAAMKGTKTYETFKTGYSRYLSLILQKQIGVGTGSGSDRSST